jgi:hypothetical protein
MYCGVEGEQKLRIPSSATELLLQTFEDQLATMNSLGAPCLMQTSAYFLTSSMRAGDNPKRASAPSFRCLNSTYSFEPVPICPSFISYSKISAVSSRTLDRRPLGSRIGCSRKAPRTISCSALKENSEHTLNATEETEGQLQPETSGKVERETSTRQSEQEATSEPALSKEKHLEVQVKKDVGSPSDSVFRQLQQEKQRADKLAAKSEQLARELEDAKQKASEEKRSYENLTWRQKQILKGKNAVLGETIAGLVEDLGQLASSVLLGRKHKGLQVENLDIAKVRDRDPLP